MASRPNESSRNPAVCNGDQFEHTHLKTLQVMLKAHGRCMEQNSAACII